MFLASLFLALSAAGLAESAPAGDAWILQCRIDDGALRTFRVAPKLLQERRGSDGRFGPNLCETFRCTVDRGQLEGTISSASLILTLRIDPARTQGGWSTVGASGLKQTSGPCDVKREKPVKAPR